MFIKPASVGYLLYNEPMESIPWGVIFTVFSYITATKIYFNEFFTLGTAFCIYVTAMVAVKIFMVWHRLPRCYVPSGASYVISVPLYSLWAVVFDCGLIVFAYLRSAKTLFDDREVLVAAQTCLYPSTDAGQTDVCSLSPARNILLNMLFGTISCIWLASICVDIHKENINNYIRLTARDAKEIQNVQEAEELLSINILQRVF